MKFDKDARGKNFKIQYCVLRKFKSTGFYKKFRYYTSKRYTTSSYSCFYFLTHAFIDIQAILFYSIKPVFHGAEFAIKIWVVSKETKQKKNSSCFAIYVSVSFIETDNAHFPRNFSSTHVMLLNFVTSATPRL